MFKYIKHFNDSQFQYSDVKVAHREVQYYSFGLNVGRTTTNVGFLRVRAHGRLVTCAYAHAQ